MSQKTVEDIFGNSFPVSGNDVVTQQRIRAAGVKYHHLSLPPLPEGQKEGIRRFLMRMVHRACNNQQGPKFDKIVAWLDFKWNRSGWNRAHGALPTILVRSERSGSWGGYLVPVLAGQSKNLTYTNNLFSGDLGYLQVEKWTQKEAMEHAFKCPASQQFFSRDHHKPIMVEEIGEIHRHFRSSYSEWDDGTYHTMSQQWNREVKRIQSAHKAQGSIPAYHSLVTPWRKTKFKDNKLRFGIECEMFTTNRRAACDAAEEQEFLGEMDSSLDASYGIEVIAPPMEFEELVAKDGRWDKFLTKVQATASPRESPTQDYGMHISISRTALGHENQVKFLCFINNNAAFCKKIGGRDSKGYGSYTGTLDPTDPQVLQRSVGKGYAINISSDDRIECRMFRYDYRQSVMFKNVEFLDSAIAFSKDAKNEDLTDKKFVSWVLTKKDRYPNLVEFLKKENLTNEKLIKSARDKLGQFVAQAAEDLAHLA